MNPNRRALVFGILAVVFCGLIFFKLAVSHHIYAPGARAFQQKVASYGDSVNPILSSYALGETIYLVVRKTYGAIAFGILGFVSAPIFARGVRVRNVALLLCSVRVLLEIAERIYSQGDPLLESVIDVLIGTTAAALGAVLYNAVARDRKHT